VDHAVRAQKGKVLEPSEVLFVDANATDEQHDALVDAFQGRLGGPLADLASLITDRRAQYRVPIEYTIEDGVGTARSRGRTGTAWRSTP
jgi:hypothetical protein